MNSSEIKNSKILIVDDQEANINVLTGLLQRKGFSNILTTTDPREVLGLITSFKPDLLLLDLLMPYLSGFEVMDQLKSILPENEFLPILVLTADINRETREKALNNRATDFLTKPFDLTEVNLRINNLLTTRYLYKQLENQNIILDEKVKERTKDLELSNSELIIAKDKAEENNKLKTAFLQNLSHEVRTPINAINGFSDLLSESEISEEKTKKYISIIQKSSTQLLSIITDILTISFIQTKQEKLTIEKIDINEELANLHAIFEKKCSNKNIELRTTSNLKSEQVNIQTDRKKFVQILTNLINNALKFTDKGFIEFGYTLKTTELEFFVKDSGIGLKEETHKKVFERFVQADDSIAARFGGTGLGLSISKEFVELLGGKIWLESAEGMGSTFYFTIPHHLSENNKNNKNNKTVDFINNSEFTVLVAEDEEYNYELIAEILSRLKVKIIHAKDGQQAVDLCKKNPQINLVLMDIKMPHMDGLTATKLIKEFRPKLTIIAQTAYALKYEIEKIKDAGLDDIITKPINKDELLSKVLNFEFFSKKA